MTQMLPPASNMASVLFNSPCFLDAMDSFMEETGVRSFVGSLQDGSIPQVMPRIMERFL